MDTPWQVIMGSKKGHNWVTIVSHRRAADTGGGFTVLRNDWEPSVGSVWFWLNPVTGVIASPSMEGLAISICAIITLWKLLTG